MGTTNKIENFKDFKTQLGFVKRIDSWDGTDASLRMENGFTTNAKVSKHEKKIHVKINDVKFPYFPSNEKLSGIEAKIGGFDCLIDSFEIMSNHTNVNSTTFERIFDCSLNTVKDINFKSGKSKYQCFIPTELSRLNSFYFQFETVGYQTKETEPAYDCLRINVDDLLFDIIQIKNEDNGFYVIESLQEMELDLFRKYCFSIKQAVGFITGYMPGGEEFIFNSDYYFRYSNYLRPEIDSMFYPLDSNPYHFLHNRDEIDKSFLKKLTRLKLNEFSQLVSIIHKSQELSASIILLLEASSVHSLLIIPSVFSVVVESLSKIISYSETGNFNPIENRKIARALIEDLRKKVDSYSDKISDDGIRKIKGRINQINSPVVRNHLPNLQKLTLPFEQLKLELTDADISAIEHRNVLLHGDILMISMGKNSESEINNYMGYISGKLYTLISALILKYVGYEGYIINHSKFYEHLCEIETDEEYFRLI